jgi:two-component system, OmpR family, phosphate regulon sensor histidine kinase PhoR
MRWWLSAVFVGIAALTAVLIAGVSSREAGRDLRANAESIAVGETVSAGFAVEEAIVNRDLGHEIVSIAGQHGLALFVFSRDRTMYASYGLRTVRWQDVPLRNTALSSALADRRFVQTFNEGRATVVALPLNRTSKAAAVVAYAPRPPAVGAAKDIFRKEVVRASLWALLAAMIAGLVAASLIARRLRRIATTARAIEAGDFARELEPRFGDEVGQLAAAINAMRDRLGDAFERLSAERNRLVLLLEQLHEGVLAVDRDLNVQFVNDRLGSILTGVRFAPGEPLPETFEELPLRRMTRSLFEPGARILEARARSAEGGIVSLVGIPAGPSDLVVLVVADITEHERLRQAEQEFVANASHELRTPVAAIASAVDALRAGAQDEPESRARFIDLIGRQASRLTRLTSALLALARAQTGHEPLEVEPVDLKPLLEEAAEAGLEGGPRVRVECDAAVTALGRRDILEQVLSNLVGNALKHTEGGEIVLRATRSGADAVIEVSDTGQGIPAEARSRVFDRFFTADPNERNGFGLGLAIARGSAEALGGTLTIESGPGRGTIARVVLPTGEA